MNRLLLLVSLSFFFMAITITSVVAQDKPNARWDYKPYYGTNRTSPFTQGGIITPKGEEIGCAHDEMHDRRMATDADYRRRYVATQEAVYQIVKQQLEDERNNKTSKDKHKSTILERMSSPCTTGGNSNVLTIPVVVHVMHLSGTAVGTNENISDAQIQAGIQHLNDAFRHIGSYAGGPYFTNAGIPSVDVEIQFCLASRDPNGNSTTGINRVSTSMSNLFSDDIVSGSTTQDDALKALSFWNSNNYMNVWLVNEICSSAPSTGCSTAGYAYLAGSHGTPHDGIVNEARFWGSNTNNSKVHIHEVGHYLNLSHTFNDPDGTGALTSCDNNNCLTQGDYVSDTPPDAGTTAYSCSTSQTANTCSTDANDTSPNNPFTTNVQDIYEDYMDYGLQSCQNTFTPAQKIRMRAALLGIRSSLLSSEGCIPVVSREAGITNILNPNGTECTSPLAPIVAVKNYGTAAITSLIISYQTDGGTVATYTWTGSLAAGASTNITLPNISFATGSHTFYAYISSVNGAGADTYANNDNYCVTFVNDPVTTFPYCENFESGNLNNWSIQNPDNSTTWTTYSGLNCGHGTAAFLNFYNYGTVGQQDRLVSKILNLSSLSNAMLTFDVAYAAYASNYSDGLQVQISTDCGETFTTTIYNKSGATLSTTGSYQTAEFFPTTCPTHWRTENLNLSAYAGSTITISFTAVNAYGNNLFIDNICVKQCATLALTPSCISGPGTGVLTPTFTSGAGGTPTYNPSTLTGLANGTYTVTVTEAPIGCSATASATINCVTACPNLTAAAPVAIVSSQSLCSNCTLSGGVIAAPSTTCPVGSTLQYSTDGGTNWSTTLPSYNQITALTVLTRCNCDANNATSSPTSSVTTVPGVCTPVTATATPTQPSCGLSNGSISVTPTGGTYAWTGGLSGANPTNVAAGTYTVTVTLGGCSATASVTLNTSSGITAAATPTQPTCGLSNGSISVTPTGGTYAWTGGLSGANPTNVAAGTYTVTVTLGGCSATTSVTLNTSSGITASATPTQPTCGLSNGSISVTPTGGTYAWTGGLSGENPTNVAAGTYTVTVTLGGCSATTSVTLNTSSGITASATPTQPTCGLSNGSISVTPTGATYAWTGGLSGANPTNVAAGTYTVTVTLGGCSATTSVTLNTSSGITASATPTQPSCGLSNGSISVTPTGGTYAWTGGLSGENPTNVAAGTYTVTVTSGGCSATASATLSPSSALTATATPTQPSCGLSNGSISVTPTGGTYAWTGGLSGANPTNVAAGTYTVTVTLGGCSATVSATLNTSSALTATATPTQPTCGLSNGSISVTPTGGTYAWTGGLSGENPTNVAAGTYTVTVTSGGCSSTASVILNTSLGITASATPTQPSCGLSNGSISVTPTGGTYAWTGGLLGENPTNVAAGTYTVTVTLGGCSATTSVTLNTSSGITASATPTQPTCGLSNGSISVTPTGGTYAWTGGLSGANPTNVAAGTYTVTVTLGGCSATTSVTLNTSSGITASATPTQPTCGLSNGSISVTPTGGTYAWTGGLSGANPTNVAAGTYTVTVTSGGCSATASATLNTSSALTATATPTQPTCGLSNGSISVTPTGGTYAWTGGLSGANPTNVAAGTYTVTVTSGGCSATASATLSPSSALTATATPTQPSCGLSNGSISVTPTGGTYAWTGGLSGANPTNVAAGTYTVTVTLGGCSATASVTLVASAATPTASNTSPACVGSTIVLNVNPNTPIGVTATTYAWSGPAGTASVQNPSIKNMTIAKAGIYTVTVTYSNGCTATATTNVTLNASPAISLATPSCISGVGRITVTATGTGLSYNIGGGAQSSNVFNGLSNGSYTVTVTNANGCTAITNVAVNCSACPSAVASNNSPVCTGGTINLTVNPNLPMGTTATYWWSGPGGTATLQNPTLNNATPVKAGVYTVTVTYSNGCISTSSTTVTLAPSLSGGISGASSFCVGGSVVLTASGGGTYLWSTSATTAAITVTTAGIYVVTITNGVSCRRVTKTVTTTTCKDQEGYLMPETLLVTPNPFATQATIVFMTNSSGRTNIKVYSIEGKQLGTLYDSNAQAGETYQVTLDATNLPSGMYFVEMTNVNGKKMLVKAMISY